MYSPPTSVVSDIISAKVVSLSIGPLKIRYSYEFWKYSEVTTTSVGIFDKYCTIKYFLSLR